MVVKGTMIEIVIKDLCYVIIFNFITPHSI